MLMPLSGNNKPLILRGLVNTILLLLSCGAIAQPLLRSIQDGQSKAPVSFATVKALHTPKGVIATEKGEFVLDISPSDSVLISCVGYKQRLIPGGAVGTTIYLEPRVKVMKELTIHETKLVQSLTLGNGAPYLNKKLTCDWNPGKLDQDCLPWGAGGKAEFAERVIVPDSLHIYHIKKVYIPTRYPDDRGPFLLHVYASDPNSPYPGEELFQKSISITRQNISKNKVVADLSAEGLYIQDSKTIFYLYKLVTCRIKKGLPTGYFTFEEHFCQYL